MFLQRFRYMTALGAPLNNNVDPEFKIWLKFRYMTALGAPLNQQAPALPLLPYVPLHDCPGGPPQPRSR